MRSAPRDGTSILAFTRDRGTIICFWEERPSRLAGPAWEEDHGAELGISIATLKAGLMRGHSDRSIWSVLTAASRLH
jgi:hypothetical protein